MSLVFRHTERKRLNLKGDNMLYQVQVKTDKQRVYRKLSIKMRSIEALKGLLTDLIVQYAQDNQLNYHTVSAQIVDENKQVVYTHLSNAQANKDV